MSKLTATTAMLMTPDEKALFRASESRLLPKVESAMLRTQIERARHLRKKYDDLLQRERAKAQADGAKPGSRAAQGNSNTVRKATAFTYAVANFEAESDRRAGVIPPTARSKSKDAPAKPATSSKKSSKGASAVKEKSSASATDEKSSAKKPTAAKSAVSGSKARSTEGAKSGSASRTAGKATSPAADKPARVAKKTGVRQQRGPAQRQVGHAAARGRRQQARSDSRKK